MIRAMKLKKTLGGAFLLGLVWTPALAIDAMQLQIALEDHFGIFLVGRDRRSSQDRVIVTGSEAKGFSAEISYWRSLQSRDPAEEICNAYTWILFGRGSQGKGSIDAFNLYPALNQIDLKFFDVDFGTKLGKKKAEVLPTSHVVPYLKVAVERKSLLSKKANWTDVKEQMAKGKCAELGNKFLDSKWFDEAYLRQGRKG